MGGKRPFHGPLRARSADLHNFRRDGQGDFLNCHRPDIQADGGVDRFDQLPGNSALGQIVEN